MNDRRSARNCANFFGMLWTIGVNCIAAVGFATDSASQQASNVSVSSPAVIGSRLKAHGTGRIINARPIGAIEPRRTIWQRRRKIGEQAPEASQQLDLFGG